MNATKVATCRAAAVAHWQLASTYRQLGKVSRSRHYAALAQTYHATAAAAELEPEPQRPSLLRRLLGMRA